MRYRDPARLVVLYTVSLGVPVEQDATRMCEALVGLLDVDVLGIVDDKHGPLEVHVVCRGARPLCVGCGSDSWVKDNTIVPLADLPAFGRPTRLMWHKQRWVCPNRACRVMSWTTEDARIAPPRVAITDRAGRWCTWQVGRNGRTVNDVAEELSCDWHTVMDAVIAYGHELVDDLGRVGSSIAVGLDETLFVHQGEFRTQVWSTSIVDVTQGRLLDIVPGRDVTETCKWFDARGELWRANVKWATLDLSNTYRKVFDTMLPDATIVADPFHVVKMANGKVDDARRRVQNMWLGHRGRKDDPLYRARKLLVMAAERLDAKGKSKLTGLLKAGDPTGELATCWHAKEVVRQIYDHTNYDIAVEWVNEIIRDFADRDNPPEVQQLGRTIKAWRDPILAWHRAHVSNGPTEAVNNLTKRIKRVAFGFTNFTNFRIRALLYAGKPNWDLLPTITPR